ncbi:MAG: cyclic pyranopterin monophosphate synthase MoaC [Pseudomonadota bacterium]|nr:cyclic pyranopterin monophosphate synthase MoaC [Pseudomonadota bacterium]
MLSHVDKNNNPTMVDVSSKDVTERSAYASAKVRLPNAIVSIVDNDEILTKKGPVFHTAIIAGTIAAKRTHELIPFCHPLGLEACKISISFIDSSLIKIDCHVRIHHKTGVEMEALTGASVAALTIYDMCKAISKEIIIGPIQLESKSGGKSDYQAK